VLPIPSISFKYIEYWISILRNWV